MVPAWGGRDHPARMARHIIGGTGARHLAKASAASLGSFSPNVHGGVAKSAA
jgi:hypothetical protein